VNGQGRIAFNECRFIACCPSTDRNFEQSSVVDVLFGPLCHQVNIPNIPIVTPSSMINKNGFTIGIISGRRLMVVRVGENGHILIRNSNVVQRFQGIAKERVIGFFNFDDSVGQIKVAVRQEPITSFAFGVNGNIVTNVCHVETVAREWVRSLLISISNCIVRACTTRTIGHGFPVPVWSCCIAQDER